MKKIIYLVGKNEYRDKLNAIQSAKESNGIVIMTDSTDNPTVTMRIYPENGYGFKVGDKVTFTNDYGVKFSPHVVTGFVINPSKRDYGRTIYWDSDAYWFPARPDMLKKIEKGL